MRPEPEVATLLSAIAARMLRRTRADGETITALPGLSLLRLGSRAVEGRGVLQPSICVVVQGQKTARAGVDTTLRYGAGDFLATSIEMPLTGHVVGATRAKPYLAVAFALSSHEVLSVATEAALPPVSPARDGQATFVGRCDAHLLDVVLRALTALDDDRDARFLAPLLRSELAYRLLTGPSAAAMLQCARLGRAEDGVGRAVQWIRERFRERLSIARLAKLARMSTSSLQHQFKAAVTMSPLQYQKRLRLEEARRLLRSGLADATRAAYEVGYASSSQFSREYRRHFGAPPIHDRRAAHLAGSGKPVA